MRLFRSAAAAALLLAATAGSASAQRFDPGPKIHAPSAAELAAAGQDAAQAPASDRTLAGAVADPRRPAADRARDRYRHPVQTLQFWGVKPGMTVVDLQPGGGYWTQILAPFLHATGGRYVAGGSAGAQAGFTAKFSDAARFGQVGYVEFGKGSGPFAPPGSVDVVITSREIHNWMGGGYEDKAMSDAFAALKPGGVLAVEEHRADGSQAPADGSSGYVRTADVIAAAQKAGFRLDGSSEVNANPKDTKDHPFGVWTLPPTRQSAPGGQPPDPAFNHAKYDAIGESDRMTLRFRKPA